MKHSEITTLAWYWLKGSAIGVAIAVTMIIIADCVR